MNLKRTILSCSLLFYVLFGSAQVSSDKVRQFITGNELPAMGLHFPEHVTAFYEKNKYALVWLSSDGLNKINSLFDLLRKAPDLALDTKDYLPLHLSVLGSYTSFLKNGNDSIRIETFLTDAAIHFFNDVKNGNNKPAFAFNGLKYTPSAEELTSILQLGIHLNRFDTVITIIEPKSEVYRNMIDKLKLWNENLKDNSFIEVSISSKNVSVSNRNLLNKLQQLGFLKKGETVDDKALAEKVKEAQRLFDLLVDGALGSYTLNALNIPLKTRCEELKRAINYFRWMNEIRQTGKVALLNIPSTQLFIYDHGTRVFDSKIIVGKPSTPTVTLTSAIKEVIVYPYWNVPHSIATKELLPRIKRDIGYLGRNNYQVLNKQGKLINPYSINWHTLSASNFPYQIRQATGCDNALGVLKFNFYNPFSMYLHDTPSKSLFLTNRRFYSHGCMRVEKPEELAKLLLKEKIASVEDLINECVENQLPIVIQLETPLPLMVFYSTAWFDEKGNVKIYPDTYKKNQFSSTLTARQ